MSAPPIGMMINTPITKASANMAKKASQRPVNMNTKPRPKVALAKPGLAALCASIESLA
jgi:hypothetical protein